MNKRCVRLEIAKVGAMSRYARTQKRARKMVQADNIWLLNFRLVCSNQNDVSSVDPAVRSFMAKRENHPTVLSKSSRVDSY